MRRAGEPPGFAPPALAPRIGELELLILAAKNIDASLVGLQQFGPSDHRLGVPRMRRDHAQETALVLNAVARFLDERQEMVHLDVDTHVQGPSSAAGKTITTPAQ